VNRILIGFIALLSCTCFSQNQAAAGQLPVRTVHGQTLSSPGLPAAEFIFGKDFRYVGGQVINLYGNADAEQHLFVKAPGSGAIEAFYWIQFEHFLPSNQYTYDYKPDRVTDIGGVPFIYDVKSFSDYEGGKLDPASDSAGMQALLARNHLAFPKNAACARMFYLPTPDKRTELMIIYGEEIAKDSKIPFNDDGVPLDTNSPVAAKMVLAHVKAGLTIKKK
jgi:hypothetical protein